MSEVQQRDWPSIVKRYEDSGLPQREFATREGVSFTSLKYYVYKMRTTRGSIPTGRLLPVVSSGAGAGVTLWRGDIRVEIHPSVRPDYVAALVRSLATGSQS